MDVDTIIAGAERRYDDDGNEIVRTLTCGHCGRSWNDAAISSLTPTPAGRCPWEYDHEYHDAERERMERISERARRWSNANEED